LPVLNVPLAKPNIVELPNVNALPNVQPPPAPPVAPNWKLVALIVTPFVVTVLPVVVALSVMAPVAFHIVPATNDMEPAMPKVGAVPVAKVTVPAETVMSRHAKAPVIVTV
jgi:hypothetical protein